MEISTRGKCLSNCETLIYHSTNDVLYQFTLYTRVCQTINQCLINMTKLVLLTRYNFQ